MIVDALLYAGLLPLIASAIVCVTLRYLRCPLSIVWPAATATGFLVAQFVLRSQGGIDISLHTFIQPYEAVDWLPHIVLLALGVSVLMYLAPAQRPWLIALAAMLCLSVPIRLLSGNLAQHWSVMGKVGVATSLTILLGLVWLLLALTGEERSTTVRVPLLVLIAVGVAIVLTQSGVFIYGLSSAALGAAITGTAVVFAFRSTPSNLGAAATAGVITFTLGSLIILGHFFAELSTTNAALLCLALTATAVPLPAFLRSRPVWQRAAARILLSLFPLAMAVISVAV
jgi:hypothetical protein